MSEPPVPIPPLARKRKTELLHRLRRPEGQVRELQELPKDGADGAKIALLRATRRALDSPHVRFNLALAE